MRIKKNKTRLISKTILVTWKHTENCFLNKKKQENVWLMFLAWTECVMISPNRQGSAIL